MMKTRNLNLVLFSIFVIFIISLPIFCGNHFLPQRHTPWQLQPFNNDSLSLFYKKNFRIIEGFPLDKPLRDSASALVSVLVDGWGIPYDEDLLLEDFSLFDKKKSEYIIHKRMFGYTAGAETEEFQRDSTVGIYVYGGDALSCKKKTKNLSVFFEEISCFEDVGDSSAIIALDSLLSKNTWKQIALTTYQTGTGNRDSLHMVLRNLARLATKHPNVKFSIQGTHRPILGPPDARRKYVAPWVPAVFVNVKSPL